MTSTADIDVAVAEIVTADRNHVLHAFAQLGGGTEPGPIFREARGIQLVDVDGNVWLDGMAGLANVSLGYGRDELADVAATAMKQLSFGTTFFNQRGHVPGAQLAQKLSEITPGGLDHFFYGVGGSDAVETAIKLARYANAVNGRPEKHHIIGRLHGYHGVTYGAMSLTGDPAMWKDVGPLLAGFSHIEQPVSGRAGEAEALEREIDRVGAENVAAFMAEPISTPNRMRIPADDYWPQIREICDRHDVLLISDEVLTGFGRSGRMFAIENWRVSPDMIVMSKAITAGYFPLSAVGVTSTLVERLGAGSDIFRHGVTNGGHAVGCAVALATIDIMERERVVDQAAEAGRHLVSELRSLAERHPALALDSVRGLGMLVAVDFDAGVVGPEFGRAAHRELLRQRIFVRDYGDGQTIGYMPALTCSSADIDEIIERTEAAIVATEAAQV
jgi:adenosylmethionine-8-amino-7-oxononanoate aminotransferase